MPVDGYYRYPTLQGDSIVFASEDDLWKVPLKGGVARRLTSGLAEATHAALSPDGKWLAFTGREEGHMEVYVMPAEGGEARRLTHLGAWSFVTGWTPNGRSVAFASNTGQPYLSLLHIHEVPLSGGPPKRVPAGPARYLSYGPRGGKVIGRLAAEPARWKRYRGGRTGDLWIDAGGRGEFKRLINLRGNLANPMWIGSRIYFLSDHEGYGNLYSCSPSGRDLRRHTHQADFYARNPSTDGRRIVFHAGGDLKVLDVKSNRVSTVRVEYRSPRVQRNRKFAAPQRYLEDASLHPAGDGIAVTARGQAFTMHAWDGPVMRRGRARIRLARWLHDGRRMVAVTDEKGEEELVIFDTAGGAMQRIPSLDPGRALDIVVAPGQDRIALHNHRCEVIYVDLKTKKSKRVDSTRHGRIAGMEFSPDGRWLAYSIPESSKLTSIWLWNVESGKKSRVTRPVLSDVAPSFDPGGRYLYFLSYREFDPVYDNMHFDLGFPRGMRPYLVTLRSDIPSPFSGPRPPEPPPRPPEKKKRKKKKEGLAIDLDGIEDRVVAFPLPEGKYESIRGISGKALIQTAPVEGSLNRMRLVPEPAARAILQAYDLKERRVDTIVPRMTGFDLSHDRKQMLLRIGNRLRVLAAGQRPDPKSEREPASKRSGWIDLSRVKISIEPPAEWKQMFRESWRLQRDHFWTADMSKIDWRRIYRRYLPLVDRIASRSEFSDLMWEMQGELATSHCYEMGGDYRSSPGWLQGFLGADMTYDSKRKGYRLTRIVRGDSWNSDGGSPLAATGMGVREGDVIVAIDGRPVSRTDTTGKLLVNRAGAEVSVTFARGKARRTVCVRTLRDETTARYRDWVEANRRRVHKETRGRVGYVHIPNMGPMGYAEFHRYYLSEVEHDGLIVDVRFNGGGHVSQLILEKLARKRLGYDFTRWHEPDPFPADSMAGPMVALTNENAGSDGDIFSHCFKLMKLGPLIGRRTWGGVIGINPRHPLVDGSITTQPEFSFWFHDVGWGVENYGTDPDIDVDIRPQDHVKGRDPQMDTAIRTVLKLLKKNPPVRPKAKDRPNLALPRLPRA